MKHPKALPYLFFAEMWERFGYYLMIGILFLYMTDTERGGLAFENAVASDVFGTFIALVFLTPFIGGLLADRLLGLRVSITLGGILMGLGYMCLAIEGMTAFYISLLLIILGNGFFKPNISTLLGNVYNEEKYIKLKDTGYSIFYLGINIGAFICNFFAAWLRNKFGWGEAFMAAGVGMFIGVIVFWLGHKHFKHADKLKPVHEGDMSLGRILGVTLLPSLIAGFLGWQIPSDIFGSDSTDAFIFGAIPIVGFYVTVLRRSVPSERKPLGALLAVMLVSIIFWTIFKQNGTALTIWAKNYTDRSMPAFAENAADKLGLLENITYEKGSYIVIDEQFRIQKDADNNAVKGDNFPPYFNNVPLSQRPAEGEKVKLVSPELFQSINPGFVVLLTPLIVGLWAFLRRRNREPEIGGKLAMAMLFTGLSAVFMIGAVLVNHGGLEKASPWWLIGSYGVITIGELCLSPVGLYLVSKLSPPRLTALMMGGWFVSTSIGNKMSGVLAALWDNYDSKWLYFGINALLALAAAIALFIISKWLNKIVREHV